MSPLRKQMLDDMVVRNLAARTRESYLAAVIGLAKHYGCSPDELSEAQVQRYLLHLIEERKLAWSSVNVACTALKFVYRVTLKRREVWTCPGFVEPSKCTLGGHHDVEVQVRKALHTGVSPPDGGAGGFGSFPLGAFEGVWLHELVNQPLGQAGRT